MSRVTRCPGMSNWTVFMITAAALGYKSTASRCDYPLKQRSDLGINSWEVQIIKASKYSGVGSE